MTAHQILSALPARTFPTCAAYRARNHDAVMAATGSAVRAEFDQGGNCLFCGESGRCPGWHTVDEADHMDASAAVQLSLFA
jgi:hypothetical protein